MKERIFNLQVQGLLRKRWTKKTNAIGSCQEKTKREDTYEFEEEKNRYDGKRRGRA